MTSREFFKAWADAAADIVKIIIAGAVGLDYDPETKTYTYLYEKEKTKNRKK